MKTKFLIPLLAGLGLLCACKGKSGAGADSTTVAYNKAKEANATANDTVLNDAKLIKTAGINIKVKNVQQTCEHVAVLTANLNGTVVHHVMGSTTERSQDIRISSDSLMRITVINTTAAMTVKIPPSKMEDFINQVSRMGIYVNNLKMDIDDKSLSYLATRLKLKNKADYVTLEKQVKSADDLLAYKDRMVDQQMVNRTIDDSVKNSIITLNFYGDNVINKEIVANDDLSAYNQSFSKRIEAAAENGWEAFEEILVALANVWVLLPIGLGIWFIVRYFKNKKPVALIKG